ncbi:hypothetical protein GS470_24110 [Rhodococcus hoagii]|nr:hypothetical protein [Prescottella equi]
MTAWDIAKWPVLPPRRRRLVAVLYYVTPTVPAEVPRISPGAAIAIVVWIGASALFAVYVSNSPPTTRRTVRWPVRWLFLLWLWITNLALLFGAEFDAELERGRELQAGLPAEKSIQLPPRDTRDIEKREKQRSKDVEDGRRLRLSHSAASPTQGKESDDA